MKTVICKFCGGEGHSATFCFARPKKTIPRNTTPKKQSTKQKEYETWKYNVAKPFVIKRDGHKCSCCGAEHKPLDLEHTLGVGSHPEFKRELKNMTLMCRYPCHDNKTNNRPCPH